MIRRPPPAKRCLSRDRSARQVFGFGWAFLVGWSVPALSQETPGAPTSNDTVAVAGDNLVTMEDLRREWDLVRSLDASLAESLPPSQIADLTRLIVSDHLWIDHANTFPQYHQIMDAKKREEITRIEFEQIWRDDLPSEDKDILFRKAEARFALQAVLMSDPEIQRSTKVRPQELKEYYRSNSEQFQIKAQVRLTQAVLPKSVHGAAALSLAEEIRARTVGGEVFFEAAESVASGSHRDLGWHEPATSALRQEILDFAATAQPGDISAIFDLPGSCTLVELVERVEAGVVPFERAAQDISRVLAEQRLLSHRTRYFIYRVLPEAYFYPQDLFDEELKRWGHARPGR